MIATLLQRVSSVAWSGDAASYTCNLCGGSCRTRPEKLGRETPSCLWCGSTVRMRAIVHMLSTELFGRSLALADFPKRPDLRGMGLSDLKGYARRLAKKLDYRNTYYHKEPRLDITAVDPSLHGTLDFLISSDVFEHVAPPVSVAFENARRLLKPGGVFIFTVPYSKEPATREHFPELYQYELSPKWPGLKRVLRNRTRDGREQVFENLTFHGGKGSTLELRVFSESSLREEFARAGFTEVRIYRESVPEHGIRWADDWSLPMTARVR